MRNVIKGVKPRNSLRLQEVYGERVFFEKNRRYQISGINLLFLCRLNMDQGL